MVKKLRILPRFNFVNGAAIFVENLTAAIRATDFSGSIFVLHFFPAIETDVVHG